MSSIVKTAQVWYWPSSQIATERLVTRSKTYAQTELEELSDVTLVWRGNINAPTVPQEWISKKSVRVVADVVFVPDEVDDLETFSKMAAFRRQVNLLMSTQIVLVSAAREVDCLRPKTGAWENAGRVFLAPVPHPVLAASADYINLSVEWDFPGVEVRVSHDSDPLPEARSDPLSWDSTDRPVSSLPFMVGAFPGSSVRPGWYDFPHAALLEQFIAKRGLDMVTTLADVRHTVTRLSKWCPLTMLPYHPVWKEFASKEASLEIVHITPDLQLTTSDVDLADIVSGDIDKSTFPFMLNGDDDSTEMDKWGIVFVSLSTITSDPAPNTTNDTHDAEYLMRNLGEHVNHMIPWFVGPRMFPYGALPNTESSRGEVLDRLLFRPHSGSSNFVSVNIWKHLARALYLMNYGNAYMHWTVVAPVQPAVPFGRIFFKPVWSVQLERGLGLVSVVEFPYRDGTGDDVDQADVSRDWDFVSRAERGLDSLLAALGCVSTISNTELTRAATFVPQILTGEWNVGDADTAYATIVTNSLMLCRSPPDYIVGLVQERPDPLSEPRYRPSYMHVKRWYNSEHVPNLADEDDDAASDPSSGQDMASHVMVNYKNIQSFVHNRPAVLSFGSFSVRTRLGVATDNLRAGSAVEEVCRFVCYPTSGKRKYFYGKDISMVAHELSTLVVADPTVRLASGVHSLAQASYPVTLVVIQPIPLEPEDDVDDDDDTFVVQVPIRPRYRSTPFAAWEPTLAYSDKPERFRAWLGNSVYFTLNYLYFDPTAASLKVYLDYLFPEAYHFDAGLSGSVIVQLVQNLSASLGTAVLGLQDASRFNVTNYRRRAVTSVGSALAYYLRGNDTPTSFYQTLGFFPCVNTEIANTLDQPTFEDPDQITTEQQRHRTQFLRYHAQQTVETEEFLFEIRVSNEALSLFRKAVGNKHLSGSSAAAAAAPPEFSTWDRFIEKYFDMGNAPYASDVMEHLRTRWMEEVRLGRFDGMEFVDWCIKNGLLNAFRRSAGLVNATIRSTYLYMYMTGLDLRRTVAARIKKAKVMSRVQDSGSPDNYRETSNQKRRA